MRKQVLFLMVLLSASFLVSTTLFWGFEQGHNGIYHFGDAAWWWFVTSSTVGYGDLVPVTTPGRIAGVIAIVIGLFGYTHVIGIILQFVQNKFDEQERGRGAVSHTNHLVICEYTAFADELIQEIKKRDLFTDRERVIVSSLVEIKPYPEYDFINGVPISPHVLKRANISEAALIFVFSNIRFSEPDTKTLHIASRIMKYNENAHILVELNNENHPLLKELPRPVTVMQSSQLLHNALQHNFIDLNRYVTEQESS